MSREYHVASTGNNEAEGTYENPFRTISKAAAEAEAGDKIIVHEGTYREWVKPVHGGKSQTERIVYEAAPGEKVIIKGSEIIKTWELVEGTMWKCVLPNTFFGDYNPYGEKLMGDWFIYEEGIERHTGDVYLNGKSFYEVDSLEEVRKPVMRYEVVFGKGYHKEKIACPEDTLYVWYARVEDWTTTIYANFQGADPNKELVEINVRKCCFYPEHSGINYIAVRGFEMAQAATPWTPPTADQPGLLGPHWSKGWIIEENTIHDSKCSGISLGKEKSTGHNLCTRYHQKPGYQHQIESVFSALQSGWSKEKIGSHIVRNNVIYDCGQNGIVGHMGCVFSEIYGNHIYNIAAKHEFFGHEIGGIKLHAALDVQIHHNRIHHCTFGTWLDWQAQGTRVSNNLFYENHMDLMVEVSHGPYLVDHNIMASEACVLNVSQGGAYVHNLICGKVELKQELTRSTPYHLPHSTQVAGNACVYGGDDRYYNNLFIGRPGEEKCGTAVCDGFSGSYEEFEEQVLEYGRRTCERDLSAYESAKQPVFADSNVYLNGAKAFNKEKNAFELPEMCTGAVIEITEEDKVYLNINLPEELPQSVIGVMSSRDLEKVRIVDLEFDDPQGNSIMFDMDYCGNKRNDVAKAGPIEELHSGENHMLVWG